MDEANSSGMSMTELLGATWGVWHSHAGMFVLLMGIPIATLVLFALIVNYVIAPHPQGTPVREIWQGMSFLQKISVIVTFLGSLAVQYRALAASVFATQEIWSGRSVGALRAIGSVRRKQLRLFWMLMLASLLTGPLGLIVAPILAFGVAPGFPVAILENTTAFAAIKRGNALAKGGHGRIALLLALQLGLVIGGGVRGDVVSCDAPRTIRVAVVLPATSGSRPLAHIADPTVVHDCAYVELLGAARARGTKRLGRPCLSGWLVGFQEK